jgi:hypothetical protein
MAQLTTVFHGTIPFVKYVFNILYSMRTDVTAITVQITSVYHDDGGRRCLRNLLSIYKTTRHHKPEDRNLKLINKRLILFWKTKVSHKECFVNVLTPLSSNYTPTCIIQSTISCITTITMLC